MLAAFGRERLEIGRIILGLTTAKGLDLSHPTVLSRPPNFDVPRLDKVRKRLLPIGPPAAPERVRLLVTLHPFTLYDILKSVSHITSAYFMPAEDSFSILDILSIPFTVHWEHGGSILMHSSQASCWNLKQTWSYSSPP